MKKLLLAILAILFLVGPLLAADPADLQETTSPASNDLLIIMDISDKTQSEDGSVNRITVDNFFDLTLMPSTILTESSSIADLSDVSDSLSPSDEEALLYDSATGTWISGVVSTDATGTDDQNATEVSTSTTYFDNNLSGLDTDVQTALETLDDMTVGVDKSGTPSAGELAEWTDSSTITGVTELNATVTGLDRLIQWPYNDNSDGNIVADTLPGQYFSTNATVQKLICKSEASTSVTASFYKYDGTHVGNCTLSTAASASNDIADVDVTAEDMWYVVIDQNATTEWFTPAAIGVSR